MAAVNTFDSDSGEEYSFFMEHITILFRSSDEEETKKHRSKRKAWRDGTTGEKNTGPIKHGPNDKRGDPGPRPISPDRVERW